MPKCEQQQGNHPAHIVFPTRNVLVPPYQPASRMACTADSLLASKVHSMLNVPPLPLSINKRKV